MADAVQLTAEQAEHLGTVLYEALLQAESDRGSYLTAINTNRDLLKADQPRSNPTWEGACDLHVPILRYMRNAYMARLSRALLASTPIHYVEGRGVVAKQLEGAVQEFLLQQGRRVVNLPQRYRSVLASTIDDGTGAVYVTWESRYERRLRYQTDMQPEIDPMTGEVLLAAGSRKRAYEQVLTYDGPRLDVLPIENVGTFPAAAENVQEAHGVYVKLSQSGDELNRRVESGDYSREAVDKLRAWSTESGHAQRADLSNAGVALSVNTTDAAKSFHGYTYDIVEWYWRYAPKDPEVAVDWLITMHQETKTILRAIHNPWGHGRRPIVFSHVLPLKFGIFGESFGDLAGQTQQFITVLLRLMVDALILNVDPELAVGSGITPTEVDKWLKSRGPGKIRKFNAEDLSKVIQPVNTTNDISMVMPWVQMLMSFAERSIGFNNAMVGQPASRSVTATEMERMITEGQELVMDMTDNASRALTEIGQLMLDLDYEFSGNPALKELWATANPDMAGADLTAILSYTYDVSSAGTTVTANRALRKQNAIETFVTLKDDPYVLFDETGLKGYNLRRALLVDGFGERKPEQYIGTPEDAQKVPMAMNTMQLMQASEEMQAQGAPPAEGGVPTGQPMDSNAALQEISSNGGL